MHEESKQSGVTTYESKVPEPLLFSYTTIQDHEKQKGCNSEPGVITSNDNIH